jgi:transcriptional regulator with XRE-family HTH domain
MDVVDALRRAVKQADASLGQISRDTGIDTSALSRFVNGERGLENMDTICKYLGLELKPKRKGR